MFGVIDNVVTIGHGSISDRTRMSNSGLAVSRIGFRGTEDLGGGLSANFWLEAHVNTDDGSGLGTNTNNQASGSAPAGPSGLTFGRRATVGLASATWGEVRAGRDFTPQYWGLYAGDVFGSVGAGAAVNYTAIITGLTSTRASNNVVYMSPNWGGVRAHAAYYLGENPSNTAAKNDGNGAGIRVTYSAGPLNLGAAWGDAKYASGDVVQRNINADWTYGIFKVMGMYSSDKNGTLNARGAALGGVVAVGQGEFKVGYSQYRTDAPNKPTAKKFAVGYVHNLSKRTALYTTYARVSNSGGSAHALNASTTAPNASSSGLDFGIRHSF